MLLTIAVWAVAIYLVVGVLIVVVLLATKSKEDTYTFLEGVIGAVFIAAGWPFFASVYCIMMTLDEIYTYDQRRYLQRRSRNRR